MASAPIRGAGSEAKELQIDIYCGHCPDRSLPVYPGGYSSTSTRVKHCENFSYLLKLPIGVLAVLAMTTSLRFEEVAAAAEVAKLLLSITVRSDKTAILRGRLDNCDCQSDNRNQ